MTRTNAKRTVIVVCTAMLAISPAEANAMIPIFSMVGLGMVMLLVPIIIIEALVAGFYLGISAWTAIKVASVGNLVSTVVGIPMTGIVLFVVGAIGGRRTERFFETIFVVPAEEWDYVEDPDPAAELQWVDGIAVFSIFALFFLASWGIEFGLANAMLDEIPPHVVNNGVLVANAATYGLLGLYLLVGVLLLFWNERRREGVASRPIGQQRALPAADSPPTDPEGDRSQELESGGPDATHQATLPDGFSPSLGNRPVGLPCPVADDGSTMNQGDVENAT